MSDGPASRENALIHAAHERHDGRQTRSKCLLVDDIQDNLIALEALLKRDDIDVLKASSGPEALEFLLAHDDIALALLDVQMPDMNGFELAELIRGSERTRHVPLIFITAGSHDRMWQFKGYETGAVDFLYKPIDPSVLQNKANVFFELHRQKRALAWELEERTKALQMNEMFMSVLSHDLRGPLTAILASAMLLQHGQDEEKTKASAARIKASGQRMGRMIEDLLDVTRVRQAGGLVLQRGPVRLEEVFQRVIDEVQLAAPQRRIDLAGSPDTAGQWDHERLCQVAANLLGNALQHGSADQPVHVHLDGTSPDAVHITISNHGEIPSALLPSLFDPFRGREHQPGRDQGLGLGLYIVKQIVLAHGGTIEVGTRDGMTAFHLHLPRSPGSAGA